jgi:hypothetical protein
MKSSEHQTKAIRFKYNEDWSSALNKKYRVTYLNTNIGSNELKLCNCF